MSEQRSFRTLGAPRDAGAEAPDRSAVDQALAEKARRTLQDEFRRVLELKARLAEEGQAGGGGERAAERVRSLVASLEGMSRFAIAMGLLTPAENREIWADAMKQGLYEGWK